jgi:hypothetical protein
MAYKLLQARGDTKELRVNWTSQFLTQHLLLKCQAGKADMRITEAAI